VFLTFVSIYIIGSMTWTLIADIYFSSFESAYSA